MSSIIPPARLLDLLETLRNTIRNLTTRADTLTTDLRSRVARERLRRQAAIEEASRQNAQVEAEAETARLNIFGEAETKYEWRKARISNAYQASKEQGIKRIEDRAGARKYDAQRKTLQAEKDREAALAANVARRKDFLTRLAAEQERLAALEGDAQRALAGHSPFLKAFFKAYEQPLDETATDEERLFEHLKERLARAETEIARLRHLLFFRIFRLSGLWIVLCLCAAALLPGLQMARVLNLSSGTALGAGAAVLVCAAGIVFGLRRLGQNQARPAADSLSVALGQGRRLHDLCDQRSEAHFQSEHKRLEDDFRSTLQKIDQTLKQALGKAGEERVSCRMRSDEKAVRAAATNVRLYQAKLARLEREQVQARERLAREAEERIKAAGAASEAKERLMNEEYEAAFKGLEREWKERLEPVFRTLETADAAARTLFPPWEKVVGAWKPPQQFSSAARIGDLSVDVETFCGGLPKEKRLALPGPAQFKASVSLACPQEGSVLIETADTCHDEAIGALNNVVLRLLSTAPPGRLKFTIIDPVGLGQNFAGVMHLADYEEQIINSRIWTQSGQIEQRLGDLNEHMEKVIQMYLRNEYATIAEYNEQAGVIAEKYHFLVIADFPANFTDTAFKRLISIAASGARCGVYTLIHWDRRLQVPQDFIPDELRKSSFCIGCRPKEREFNIAGRNLPGTRLQLDVPPDPESATRLVHEIGLKSRDSSRVEVPFEHVAPGDSEWWTEETTQELRVPIGRTGATKFQYLAIGKGTRQHGLVAGKTGSGKSTLFHVLITNLSLWCSPEQVEFYLVDFKKGVEFKCYGANRLPHARVVAIESDREFGLSVLQRVDEELKRRGDLFRQLGVQDVPGYKRAGGTESIPRSLLLIDEFQEFFVEDDKIAQTASLLLDRIVRQGRAFGIHVLLGSQTLGGAYTVARTTLGQMVVRIALQCNEADAYLIMDENNPAPRLLSRPGEGIYNDAAGALEGNSPFQVVWLPDHVRDSYLKRIRAKADQNDKPLPGPIVFEGNAPADIRENTLLSDLLAATDVRPSPVARIWLGAPNSIKGPTEAAFQRQSGSNLLLVGQREEAVLAMFTAGLVALSAQYPPGTAQVIVLDGTAPGTPQREYMERLARVLPGRVTLAKAGEIGDIMTGLAAEMKTRSEAADPDAAPPVFLMINGLQKYSRLRFEEDFSFSGGDSDAPPNPGVVLNNLICEGARLGFHIITAVDSYNNVTRSLSRKAISEFEMRVLFQMSANDSASLIDNPRAGTLGLHRALFYNLQEGHLETFRPYALPGKDWVEEIGKRFARPVGGDASGNVGTTPAAP